MKFNYVKVIKISSWIASALGAIGAAWATSVENKTLIKKLVEDHFKQ